jgi:arabinose-5-phosphate isomerase
MRPDLMDALVDDIMTANPKVIEANSLASEAIELLNSARITTLIVTEANKPVGLLHMHDLLKAGVA